MAKRLRGWVPRVLTVAAISTAAAASVTSSASTRVTVTALSSPENQRPLPFFSSFWEVVSDGGTFSSVLAAQQGFLRSSRAIYTFALNSYDYKYSLRGYDDKSPEYYEARSEVHKRAAKRLLELCEANKGFYVKAGQFVGSLQNIPKEYLATLSVLQDHARSRPFQAIERVLVTELGKEVLDIFAEFDQEPIAAASLAQVHRAVLKDSKKVAVKVQYPQLQEQFQMDMKTMTFLSKAVSWLFPDYQFEWIVPEFEKNLSKELNFIMEGQNAERTARNFENNDHLKVPHIFWDYTTERILTMEFMDGCKVDDIECLKKAGVDPLQVAELLVEVFAEMVFSHGFVHGDPHPGNILVHPRNGRGKRNFDLVLLDHGLYRELDDRFRVDYCRLWKALILLDPNEMEKAGDRLGAGKYYRYLPVIFIGRPIGSKGQLGKGMTPEERASLRSEVQHFTMGDISELMEGLPRDFLTVLRTDGLLRSITHKLGAQPRMRLMANAKYAVMGLVLEHRVGPGRESQGLQAQAKALYDYANLRIRLEIFELSYKFGLLYGSLLHHLQFFYGMTIGKLSKTKTLTV
ncbi:unnamed protein product [Calypogeia fissa]